MTVARARIGIRGVVQGVGFRPWAARRARARGLAGGVRNTLAGVEIDLEGARPAIDGWLEDLDQRPPPGVQVETQDVRWEAPRGSAGFVIAESRSGASRSMTRVPPDVALCAACLEELFDPGDRRHRYPFTHCAECGPRASLVEALPFDRVRTTLVDFPPCETCLREYADPEDRRYHAQTLACPHCGPRLRAWGGDGEPVAGDPVEAAARVLAAGGVAALHGYGGFHLAVDATQPEAVARLRKRKGRPVKPFAVLLPDLAAARSLVRLGAAEEALLAGPGRPVLVAPRRPEACAALGLYEGVAPGSADLGVLLPYAPVHHLLLHGPGARPDRDPARFPALVFTSANRSEEPTLYDPSEARARLAGIADLGVGHDRRVARPSDDPVFRSAEAPSQTGAGPIPIRLSRATAPRVLRLPDGMRAETPVLALGGDLKSAPALVVGTEILLAEHVGDLSCAEAYDALATRATALCRLLGVTPTLVVHDRHPDALGARLARALAPRTLAVQHHHAHALACLAEHGERGPALAWVLDGAGFGLDGTVWGGELLHLDGAACTRRAHLECVGLPGGDAAAREPWRMAAVWLDRAFPDAPPLLPWLRRHEARARERIVALAERASPRTSSAGRLFDAVASLLDLCDRASHEGEAAAAVEALAASTPAAPTPALCSALGPARAVVPVADLVAQLALGHAAGRERAALARGFHECLADRLAAEAASHAREVGVSRVALSGGCFQNRILLDGLARRLVARGLEVRVHRRVPPNDGGLAVGQLVAALAAGG